MNSYKLVLLAGDVGDVHVMGGGAKIFEFLASKDVNCDKMDLGVAVLAGLGGAHFNDLARAAFDDDESVLAQRRALHGIGGGSTGIGALESMLMLQGQMVSTSWKKKARPLARDWRGKCTRENGNGGLITWASSAIIIEADGSEMKRSE